MFPFCRSYIKNIKVGLIRNVHTVDLLFPNDDVPIRMVLFNIASRGLVNIAILKTPENEERNSITVNVLAEVLSKHRNIPQTTSNS